MATIDIRVDGVSITDHCIFSQCSFTGIADGNPGAARVVIDNSDRSYSRGDFRGKTLELYVDGTREWDGWVMGLRRSWPFPAEDTSVPDDAPRFWTLTGYDRNLLFRKRVMYRTDDPSDHAGFRIWAADTPDKTALEYGLANYLDLSGDGLTWDIQQIDSPSPWEEFTLGFVSAPMGVMFEDCSEMTGGVFWIGPDRVGYYKDDRTVTAPFALSDTPSGSDVGYRELDAGQDYTEAATEALVWGAGKGAPNPVFAKYTNTTARDTYGLWQWGDVYIGAWRQETVNRRARTYVIGSPSHRRGHDEPVPYVKCVIFEPGIRVGHVVDFETTVYGYQENLPVRKSTITFPTPSSVKYELELTLKVDMPWGIPDPWWDEEPPYQEVLPPEGTGGISADVLIDHFDADVQWWTSSEANTSPVTGGASPAYGRKAWLPNDIPGGIQENDIICVFWTYTQQPDGVFPWNNPESPFDSVSSGVAKWKDVSTFFDFSTLLKYDIEGASVLSEFFRVTATAVPYFADKEGDSHYGNYVTIIPDYDESTAVGYATLVIRGIGEEKTPYVDDGSFGFGAITTWQAPLVRDVWHSAWGSGDPGGDDYLYFSFISMGGNDDNSISGTGEPLLLGQMFAGYIATFAGGDPFDQDDHTYDPDWTVEEMSMAPSAWLPAFGLGSKRTTADHVTYSTFKSNTPIWQTEEVPYPIQHTSLIFSYRVDGIQSFGNTPGPEVTGSQYDGGNPWVINSKSGTLDDWGRDDSSAFISTPGGSFAEIYVEGPTRVIEDDDGHGLGDQGTVTISRPEGAWDQRFIALLRFRPTVPDVFLDAPDDINGSIYLQYDNHQLDPGNGSAILNESWVGVYWDMYQDPADDAIYLEIDSTLNGGSGDTDVSTYEWIPDPGFTIVRNEWHLLKIDFGTDDELRVKVWQEGFPEPEAWHKAVTYHTYRTDSTYAGSQTGSTSANKLLLGLYHNAVGEADGSTRLEIDYIMSAGAGSGVGDYVSDVPIFDSVNSEQASLYITTYPYLAGTLEVWYEGTRLRPGIDFIETDPSAGEFRILGDRDITSGLVVRYQRSGTDVAYTGGRVYRPAPQLQYGWGTPLDGYNCNMACSAMALDRHTLGEFTAFRGEPRSTPPNHRGFQYDQVGGTDLFDAATAWSNGWGKTLYSPGNHSWAVFQSLINDGRGAILQGVYGNLPASKRFSSFTGEHSIYINEQFSNGNFWGIDPLYRYPVIYTTAELQAYAVGLWEAGKVSAAFTRITS